MEAEINTPKFANGHTTDSVVALFKRMAEENQDYHYSFFSPETERMMNNKILYTMRTWSINLGKHCWKVTNIPLNQVRYWVRQAKRHDLVVSIGPE